MQTFLTTHENTDDKYEESSEKLEQVFDDIATICAQENKEKVEEYLNGNSDGLEGFNQAKIWSLKKKLAPKNSEEPPMAKKDSKGNLISDKSLLEKLYLDTYVNRLKPNKMASGLEDLEELKEYLFKLRYENCKAKKSKDWSVDDLEKALKSAKNNKARDAHGHIYEIFKYGGADLKSSLVKMFNLIRYSQDYPDILKPSNITSLYKKKGEKSNLDNDRGIFSVVKLRSMTSMTSLIAA